MELAESKVSTQVIPGGMRCRVCDHDSVKAINSLLATATLSNRRIALQFNLTEASVRRHSQKHVPAVLARASERRMAKDDDLFLSRHEHLYSEALQYIVDAKSAVKMQKVTVERETDEGIVLEDRYREFRDVGAMAPAIQTATQLQRVLGDATGRFAQAPAVTGGIHLSVILPRVGDAQPAAINVTAASSSQHQVETSSVDIIDVPALPSSDSD